MVCSKKLNILACGLHIMISPPITIEALLVLDAIEHRGSYAAAAEQLNKVPSALSYIVQKLEEQLNVTIFQRQGRRAVLTPAGKHLLIEGRKVLYAIHSISEQTQTIANGWEPNIRIACDSIIDIKPIFNAIQRFLLEHQSIEIDVKEEVMNGTWEALVDDRVDLVIGAPSPVPSQKGIRAVKIEELTSILVVGQSHELARKLLSNNQLIHPSELANYRNVVVHDSSQHEIPWSINMIEGSQHFYVSSIAQKVTAIIAGIGIGYLPRRLAQHYMDTGQLIVIETGGEPIALDLFMAWKVTNKGKGLSTLVDFLSNKK